MTMVMVDASNTVRTIQEAFSSGLSMHVSIYVII